MFPCLAWQVTDFDYEATREESQSNPWGSGDQVCDSSFCAFHPTFIHQVLRDLATDFNLTAREAIALMGTHAVAPQVHLLPRRSSPDQGPPLPPPPGQGLAKILTL